MTYASGTVDIQAFLMRIRANSFSSAQIKVSTWARRQEGMS